MRFNEYKKLEEKINCNDFSKGYKNINIVLYVLSIFGNLASIFLAYFLLSKILLSVMSSNIIVTSITSLMLLTGLELLKRDIFDKFSIQYLKNKSFNKNVIPLFIVSCCIICTSFFLSINGAKEFSSKTEVIDKNKNELIKINTDSLSKKYNDKILSYENEINIIKNKIESKDKEQTDLESIQPPSYSQKSRIKDLKNDKLSLKGDIDKLLVNIDSTKSELSVKIKEKEKELILISEKDKESNTSNSISFIILSSIIELVILFGVYFNEYYKFKSYREFRDRIGKDPNYQKWILYDKILSIIYSEDTKNGEKLASNKSIIESCKINDIIVMPKDITNFLKICNNLGIIKVSGNSRYISKPRDLSFEILKNQFNIK